MLNRVPFVLASLFAAACAESPSAHHSVDLDPDGVGDDLDVRPAPNPLPVDESHKCVSVDTGFARHGTAGVDELRDVMVTNNGSILVAGFENGYPGSGGPAVGSRGIVLEYSHDMTKVTHRAVLDTLGTDSIESIAMDPDTNQLWFAARTNEALAETQANGDFDLVVGELLHTGGMRPRYRGFDQAAQYARRLSIAPGGHFAVAGHQMRSGSWDPFLGVFAMIDRKLEPQWFTTRVAAATETNEAVAISATAVYTGGTITDTDEQGMFITARSLDADLLWHHRLTGAGIDSVTALHVLPDGDVLWAGSSSSLLGAEQHGGLDIVVGRIDGESGKSVWTVQHGGSTDEHVSDLTVDAQGRIFVVGDVATGTDSDAFVLALDSEGNPLLHEQWGSDGDDQPAAVAVDACGAIVVAGTTHGDFNGSTPVGRGDGFVLVTRISQ